MKKENKMTWEPKNGLHDEDVDVSEEEEDGDNSFTKEDVKPNALGKSQFCSAALCLSTCLSQCQCELPPLPPSALSTCFPPNGIIAQATVSKTLLAPSGRRANKLSATRN